MWLDGYVIQVIVDDSLNIVGLIDWEDAALLPLGMNAWCIRYLSVPNRDRIDVPMDKTRPMAEAFWAALVESLPPNLKSLQQKIVDAMQIGYVLTNYYGGGAPEESKLPQLLERLDWMEETFRPMCALP